MTTADARPAHPSASARTSPRAWWRSFGRAPRLMGLDVARAIAVIGMVAAHAGTVEDEFRLFSPASWPGIVHGYPALLFALLAGFSVSLLTRGGAVADADLPAMRLRMVGRGAAIFTIGLLLELLGTPIAVILTLYGVLYIAVIPALRWRTSRLVIAALALGLVGPPLLALIQVLSLGSTGSGLGLVLFGAYPLTVWLCFALAGMALARLPLRRTATAVWFVVAGAAAAALAQLIGAMAGGAAGPASGKSSSSNGEWAGEWDAPGGGWPAFFEQVRTADIGSALRDAVLSLSAHSGSILELVAAFGMALFVIGACLLAVRPLRWVLLPLAALGSMPLTAYTAHVISYFAAAAPWGMVFSEMFVVWSVILLLIAATAWSMIRGRGPLETLVARAADAAATVRRPS